jgi:SAM-dependent methyltransferase
MTEPTVDADAFNAFEAEGWQKQAATYGDFFGTITSQLADPLLDAAEVGRADSVLDVASGPGYVAATAADRDAAVIGIDVAEAMISLASRLHPSLDFRYGNVEALPFPEETFDAVVGNFIMLHVGRPERAAAEFARVLISGGRVALTVWDVPEKARILGVLVDAIAAVGVTPPAGIPVGPPIFRFADDDEFARLLNDQGFEDVQVRTISFSHSVPSADALWHGLIGGTVRTSALIVAQSEETQQEIRAAFEEIVRENEVGDHLELPVSIKLASGQKAEPS